MKRRIMNKKLFLTVTIGLGIALTLTACGGKNDKKSDTTKTTVKGSTVNNTDSALPGGTEPGKTDGNSAFPSGEGVNTLGSTVDMGNTGVPVTGDKGPQAKTAAEATASFTKFITSGVANIDAAPPVAEAKPEDYLKATKDIKTEVGLSKVSGLPSGKNIEITAMAGTYTCTAILSYDLASKKTTIISSVCK